VASAEQRLQGAGFTRLEEGARWSLAPGGRHYVLRGGASLIAFTLGSRPLAEAGFRIVGAHTDSPGLRLKPRPAWAATAWRGWRWKSMAGRSWRPSPTATCRSPGA
jgi:aspartyl aminopeptidase